MPHIFISYSKKDTRALAFTLADALNALSNVTAWVDRSLKAGPAWETQIQMEILKCDYFVVLYSPDINRHLNGEEESYVLTEISYAKFTAKKPIIPVMAQKTDPPISLARAHYIDFTLPGLGVADLVQAICAEVGVSPTPAPPASPPAASVISVSPSFDPVQAAIQRARSFKGKRNADWQPFVTTFPDLPIPDMPFCLVPVGSFMMGSGNGYDDEKPAHPQTIRQPYWIAQYPVTNAQWALAVRAGVVKEPNAVGDSLKWYRDPKGADAPVVGINWFMARDFAAWLGCRLPTEREWEYAARGVESWIYPWGNDWAPDRLIWHDNSGGKPGSVTSKSEGASWVDARHLSGNVWEWTSSLYLPYDGTGDREADTGIRTDVHRVLRGGSWVSNNSANLRSADRDGSAPDVRSFLIGFRCARSS